MSKKRKSKKKRRPNVPIAADMKAKDSADARVAKLRASRDFNPDYSHVIKDLKRIGILAGSLIGLLIILSFILK